MIAVTTGSAIEGYGISQYKGTAQGATFDELVRHAATSAPCGLERLL
jgi:hypothetical protein